MSDAPEWQSVMEVEIEGLREEIKQVKDELALVVEERDQLLRKKARAEYEALPKGLR